jgi:hypothetical protein
MLASKAKPELGTALPQLVIDIIDKFAATSASAGAKEAFNSTEFFFCWFFVVVVIPTITIRKLHKLRSDKGLLLMSSDDCKS